MKQSLKKLMEGLPNGIDGAIITSDQNRRYFTDMKSSAGALLLTKNAVRLIIDFRYIEMAKKVITDFDVALQSDNLYSQISDFFKDNHAKNIAVEADSMTVMSYKRFAQKLSELSFSDDSGLSDKIVELRSIKSLDEIDKIKKAQAITDKTFSHICDFIKIGMTEREIAVEMEYFMRLNGASGIAFDSIVVSGVNSSLPHGVPSDKKIASGDFVTMDFGAAYDGYCSDMTRTIAMGKISEEQQRVYDTVLKSQLMAIEAISLGKNYSDIDKVARDYIYQNGYEGCFGHGLGHSLGLDIHEEPRLSYTCDKPITENVIMTVEPGVYLANKFGVRIEDMVVINKSGAEIITKSDKNLITL